MKRLDEAIKMTRYLEITDKDFIIYLQLAIIALQEDVSFDELLLCAIKQGWL